MVAGAGPLRGRPTGACLTCRHPERPRIDYLLAQGATKSALARQFNIPADSVYRHGKRHIPADFVRAIRIGPHQSEAHLRKLCADSGSSVLDNLKGIYGGLASRWLACFETGADNALCGLTTKLHDNLELQARLTRELLPPSTTVVNNIFALPDFALLQQALLRVTSAYPEVRAAIVRELKAIADRSPPAIEVSASAIPSEAA